MCGRLYEAVKAERCRKGAVMLRVLVLALAQAIGSAAIADTIFCQPETWFNQSNQQGAAQFSFSFEFIEQDGALTFFRPSGFNCEQFDQLHFTSSEIYLNCSRSAMVASQNLGRFEVITKINRYTGSMTQFQGYKNSQNFTIYEGNCVSAERKF